MSIVKDTIRKTAAQLFVEQGYTQTTIREIANKMGISHSNIANYYKIKNDIAADVIMHYLLNIKRESIRLTEEFPDDVNYNKEDIKMFFLQLLHFKLMEENQNFRRFYISFFDSNRRDFISVFIKLAKNMPFVENHVIITDRQYYIDDSISTSMDVQLVDLIDLNLLTAVEAVQLFFGYLNTTIFKLKKIPSNEELQVFYDTHLGPRKYDILNDFLLK